MPAFNAEEFIDETIASIRHQTHGDFDLHIVNNGSTDRNLDTIKEHSKADSRINYRSRSNAGLVTTLNELIEFVETPFVGRMDVDDISHPQRLELQLAEMKRNPELLIVGCWVELFGDKEEVWHYCDSNQETRIINYYGRTCLCHASTMT